MLNRATSAAMRASPAILALVVLTVRVADAQPNPYHVVEGWPNLGGFRSLGSVSAVYPDGNGNVWIAERCGENGCVGHDDVAPIILLDRTGRPVRSFGAGLFVWPHGLYVDERGNVWVTDGRGDGDKGFQVIEFSPNGQVLLRLGEAGVAGDGPGQFSGPTGVVVGSDGTIFVTDGHEAESNHRVMKFSPDGRLLATWGKRGSKPGEFDVPHAVALDSRGRLFIADRDNNRVQVFDQEGNFIDQFSTFGRPSGLYIDADDTLYVSDNQSNDERNPGWTRGIRIGSARDGSVAAFIPDPEFDPANSRETGAHGLAVDAAGNIYGAEVWSQSVKKYARGAGREP